MAASNYVPIQIITLPLDTAHLYVAAAMDASTDTNNEVCAVRLPTWKGSSVSVPSLSASMLNGKAKSLSCIALPTSITVLVTT